MFFSILNFQMKSGSSYLGSNFWFRFWRQPLNIKHTASMMMKMAAALHAVIVINTTCLGFFGFAAAEKTWHYQFHQSGDCVQIPFVVNDPFIFQPTNMSEWLQFLTIINWNVYSVSSKRFSNLRTPDSTTLLNFWTLSVQLLELVQYCSIIHISVVVRAHEFSSIKNDTSLMLFWISLIFITFVAMKKLDQK